MIVTSGGLITNHARVLICGDARARGIGARKIELAVCGIAFTRARRGNAHARTLRDCMSGAGAKRSGANVLRLIQIRLMSSETTSSPSRRAIWTSVVSPSETYSVGTINDNSSAVLYRTTNGVVTWQNFRIADQGGIVPENRPVYSGSGELRLEVFSDQLPKAARYSQWSRVLRQQALQIKPYACADIM